MRVSLDFQRAAGVAEAQAAKWPCSSPAIWGHSRFKPCFPSTCQSGAEKARNENNMWPAMFDYSYIYVAVRLRTRLEDGLCR